MEKRDVLEQFLAKINRPMLMDETTAESIYGSLKENEQKLFMQVGNESNERTMVLVRATNRLADAFAGNTWMDDDGVLALTWDSSVSELPILFEVFMSSAGAGVMTIGDMSHLEDFDLDDAFKSALLTAYNDLYEDDTVRFVRVEGQA